MTLKAALQADLGEKNMNLGDLADKLEIKQQSVSKWLAKDEIPKDRLQEVLAVVGQESRTAQYVLAETTRRLRDAMGGKHVPRPPPQPGDEDEEVIHIQRAEHQNTRPYQERTVREITKRAPIFGGVHLLGRERVEPWARLLNAPERRNVLRVIEIHGSFRRFDYLSDKLALMVRPHPTIDPLRMVNTAMPLLLIKARNPAIECKLVLLPAKEINQAVPRLNRDALTDRAYANRRDMVKLDLQALGVNLVEFTSAQEVAALIEATENPDPSMPGPVFSYEDYPEDELTPADREPDI